MAERMCPIAAQAAADPSSLALETEERRWSYCEVDATVHLLSLYLKTLGIEKGSRVAFIAHLKPATIFLFFALFRLGAIACPLSFREPKERHTPLLFQLGATHFLNCETLPLSSGKASTQALLCEEALCSFLFTSGSSGMPKIACHTIGNHLYNALGAMAYLALSASSRYLLSLPLFHIGGLAILFRLFLSGGTVVLSHHPLQEALKTKQLTHLSLVPTQLYRLLQETTVLTHSARFLIGGAPLAHTLYTQAVERGFSLIVSYGMTEMSSLIFANTTLLPFRELCIKEKEIYVRGKTLFSGYLKANGTCELLLEEGWFATRDLGEWLPEGPLRIHGRKDRLFISGGENIQPEEIERALCSLQGILFARVEPTPDSEFGQRPIAYIHDTTQKYTVDTLRHHLAPLLPSFKHPIRLLPYPLTGKGD